MPIEVIRLIKQQEEEPRKQCSRCKEPLQLSNFYNDRSTHDGLSRWCKSCIRTYQSERAENSRRKRHKSTNKGYRGYRSRLARRSTQTVLQARLKYADELIARIEKQPKLSFVFRPELTTTGQPYCYSAYLPPDLINPVMTDIVTGIGDEEHWQWNCYPLTRPGEYLRRMEIVNRYYYAERLGVLELLIEALGWT